MSGIYIYLDIQNQTLLEQITQKENKLKNEKLYIKKMVAFYKKLKTKQKKLKKQIKEKKDILFVEETTLKTLPLIGELKLKRQKIMNDVVEVLAKYKLNTQYINQDGSKGMEIKIISTSNQRDKIAKFIKDLIQKDYSSVSTDQIKYKDGIYTSIIKVIK